jgi:hypothetical protein
MIEAGGLFVLLNKSWHYYLRYIKKTGPPEDIKGTRIYYDQ